MTSVLLRWSKLSPVMCTALIATVLWTPPIALVEAAPYLPTDDRTVLERLPSKPLTAAHREIQALRRSVTENPRDEQAAAALARRYVALARENGDPRHLGHAQAVLAPWWEDAQASPTLLVLRATIKQSLHNFDDALCDLDRALAQQPHQAQAHLTRATILRVQGRYEEAQASCRALSRTTSSSLVMTCLSDLAGLTGRATPSYLLLAQYARTARMSVPERTGMLVVLAEMAARVGRPAEAEGHFQEAVRLGTPDLYLLGAYADFLLDQQRAEDVLRLLSGVIQSDGLLLRAALAQQALASPHTRGLTALLEARFAASRQRGDRLHLREEARFALSLLGQPHTALGLAQANWTVQREPWDARILLESALAAQNAAAAKPVLEWMRTTKIEDATLSSLAERIKRLRS